MLVCGFAGFLSKKKPNNANASIDVLKKMGLAIQHRGPDSSGEWVDSNCNVGFSHRRLAVVDLSPAGYQPMTSHNERFVIAFNGEIYNHLELRKELQLEGFCVNWQGHSDTETILAGFEYWGVKETIEKSVGMFAFSVWDRKELNLTLGRDRLGEKPLYYGWQGDTLLFGSELKALKSHPDFNAEINRDAITLLLRHSYIPAPHSIYQGIHKLLPGNLLRVDIKTSVIKIIEYWSIQNTCNMGKVKPFIGTPEQSVDSLEQVLKLSIKEQMVADVPLGAFLSGGVDSSAVVALMQSQSEKPVKTFSIGFYEEGYNEAIHAKKIAEHLGTDHTELYVTAEQAMSVIPLLAEIYDEPFSDASQIPTFLVSQIAKAEVIVSLSGDGGDEIFCGYSRYIRANKLWSKLIRIPKVIRLAIASSIRFISEEKWDALNSKFLSKRNIINLGFKLHKAAKFMLSESIIDFYRGVVSHTYSPEQLVLNSKEPETAFSYNFKKFNVIRNIEQMMAMDSISYLPDGILTKVDRASMAVSLESRVPFLNHKVIEFAWSLPLEYKLNEGVTKWCLKEVLYKYVPKDLMDRPKMGFGIPIGAWLRGPLKEWAALLLDEKRLQTEGFFDPELVSILWHGHQSGKHDWGGRLWDILMFQAWYEKNKEI